MLGLKVKHLGKEFKFGSTDGITSIIVLIRDSLFTMEGGTLEAGFISSFIMVKEDTGFEFEVVDIKNEEMSEPLSEKNPNWNIDPEYEQMTSEPEFLNRKLEEFRRLEAILKEEGFIE